MGNDITGALSFTFPFFKISKCFGDSGTVSQRSFRLPLCAVRSHPSSSPPSPYNPSGLGHGTEPRGLRSWVFALDQMTETSSIPGILASEQGELQVNLWFTQIQAKKAFVSSQRNLTFSFKKKNGVLVRDGSAAKAHTTELMAGAHRSSGPTQWKERNDSHELPSNFHTCGPIAHKHTKYINAIKKFAHVHMPT